MNFSYFSGKILSRISFSFRIRTRNKHHCSNLLISTDFLHLMTTTTAFLRIYLPQVLPHISANTENVMSKRNHLHHQ